MAAQDFDPDMYTKMFTFTSKYHRDLYPAIEAAQSSGSGKHVLVTGASKGLGRAMALSWARAGAAGIAICSRKVETLAPVAAEIKALNSKIEVLALACDTTKSSDVAKLFEKSKENFGKLDVVIANVGLTSYGKIGEEDEEEWWDIMTTNIRSAHLAAHHYIRIFGPDPIGTFITMTSGVAGVAFPGLSSYGMSKSADINLVEYLDIEYASLKAFSMDPGVVKGVAAMPAFVPYAFDTPELVGAFSIWLASGRADKVKGGYVHITWDVEELEKYGDEIKEKGLLKSKFLGGLLGNEGGALKK
ncbi:NAD(P)-binding protein [Cucurbitaria berberidis CBS 394.84]|uniref:NAD(P)-binding protein n=1 Tax=Cucurbitaria berberidis CBS 394.84 TaxID=1168544 RepID=A0A9P4L5A5_9PLEO|nr:NAD(P)-binding protein [Cucurbitaria berberidis CBS 394.84]KAF1842751.1 NAD(P)-binding protein [Cucurbitaria berberidis CBS 394.84]